MTVIIGIDPGSKGGLALIVDGQLVDVEDMPMIDKRVNVAVLAAWITEHHRIHGITKVTIENVHSMPGQGVATMFRMGRSFGEAIGCVIALGHMIEFVPPQTWKKALGLTKRPGETKSQSKSRSRQLATDLYPSWSQTFKRVQDDGRAEAVLIARWGFGSVTT